MRSRWNSHPACLAVNTQVNSRNSRNKIPEVNPGVSTTYIVCFSCVYTILRYLLAEQRWKCDDMAEVHTTASRGCIQRERFSLLINVLIRRNDFIYSRDAARCLIKMLDILKTKRLHQSTKKLIKRQTHRYIYLHSRYIQFHVLVNLMNV